MGVRGWAGARERAGVRVGVGFSLLVDWLVPRPCGFPDVGMFDL